MVRTTPRGIGSVPMRHIATLIAAVVIAPLAWILLAFGQDRSVQVIAAGDRAGYLHGSDFLRPVLVLAAAGLLLGLIATLRFSPLGATVAGAGYAATYLLLLAAPGGVLGLFGHDLSIAGRQADMSTPIRTGTSLALGGLMLVALVSVGRWRGRPRREEPAPDDWLAAEPTSRTGGDGGLGGGGVGGGVLGGGLAPDPEPAWQGRYTSRPQSEPDTAATPTSSWVASLRSYDGR